MAPEPPYEGVPLPPSFRQVPFDELPLGLQRRIERETPEEGDVE